MKSSEQSRDSAALLTQDTGEVLIVGAGIGGLTLGLMLHAAGIGCRIVEATREIKPLGVGINLLPHAMHELGGLGLAPALAERGVLTAEAVFYNRFGQLIYREPLGRAAGYPWPQISIHRGDLHQVLIDVFRERVGADRLRLGRRCVRAEQDGTGVTLHFEQASGGESLAPERGLVAIGADGVHSAIRKQFYPQEGEPIYSGITMWRGVTRWPPILTGASMIRAGWFRPAKLVVYPIRDAIDAEGRQLVNWVVEIETSRNRGSNWTLRGQLEDFIDAIEDWHFAWLDVPKFVRQADIILEYPMVDRDPVPRWSFDRITLLGDAAHPMYPRGSNGAGQAILDARALSDCLMGSPTDPIAALGAYEARRLRSTAEVVRANRSNPPDAILGEVYRRTGDRPFADIDEVITREELIAITDNYKRIAGYEVPGSSPLPEGASRSS